VNKRELRCGVVNKAELAFAFKFRVHVNDESGSRVEEEFEALDLGDPRRDRRANANAMEQAREQRHHRRTTRSASSSSRRNCSARRRRWRKRLRC
jgi:hypothetical protein